jgi:mercuric reductase
MGDQNLRMAIQGMTCSSCERHVMRAVTQAGALEITASYRRRGARFRYDADADRDPLVEAVQEAGYRPAISEEVSTNG